MEAATKSAVSIDYFLKEAYNNQCTRKLKINFQFPNILQKRTIERDTGGIICYFNSTASTP